ncbi:MAG: lipid-binding protein [Winogradskyella sp.]|uniref:YceI family protein n=1 Tax=Winogradskyella poriferorum TaxID=307627 RepID=A0ABU7W9B1_9FLAO|nr:lipid-binding protein [Winogradskyella sp.]|tara:strand:+ start:273 stop:926 length:654 start_codon:yes stop_codon:yes gene_type:complete
MKTNFLKITALVAFVAFSSCKDKAEEAETKAAEEAAVAKSTAVTFKADTDRSTIVWKGFKPTGSHEGTISIKEGNIAVNDKTVESGKFTIDMSTIVVTDIPESEEGNAKLQGHLSGPDFFDVKGFPTAEFEVTGLENKEGKTMLSGNLTMKGETNNISFPVKTSFDEDMMTLKSETFTIDRSKWNIKYGSKSFFDDLGDKFINDDIELTVNLVAKKA